MECLRDKLVPVTAYIINSRSLYRPVTPTKRNLSGYQEPVLKTYRNFTKHFRKLYMNVS